jgi:hypothetical protein
LVALFTVLVTPHAYSQEHKPLSDEELSKLKEEYKDLGLRSGMEKRRTELYMKMLQGDEHSPVRRIKMFLEPAVFIKGSAQKIGFSNGELAKYLIARFLEKFSFLQKDYHDDGYASDEIGLFRCEVWTVGYNYPLAFHIECAGGPLDEPRYWTHATLGYGPRDKLENYVKQSLNNFVEEYASFVLNAHGKF